MAWPLARLATVADDVAAGLQIFADNVPQAESEINKNIAEFFTVSSAFRALNKDLDRSLHGVHASRISADIDLMLASFDHTVDAVREKFGQTEDPRRPGYLTYEVLWDELNRRFKDEGQSLRQRLKLYSGFCYGLIDVLRGSDSSPNYTHWQLSIDGFSSDLIQHSEVDEVRSSLSILLKHQEPVDEHFGRLDLDQHGEFPQNSTQ